MPIPQHPVFLPPQAGRLGASRRRHRAALPLLVPLEENVRTDRTLHGCFEGSHPVAGRAGSAGQRHDSRQRSVPIGCNLRLQLGGIVLHDEDDGVGIVLRQTAQDSSGGGEESFGYLAGDYVRDKDAVSACSLAAEAAAWAMDTMGLTLYEWLQELYVKYGFYREGLVSVVRKGKEGAELIQKMMVDFRANPPKAILGSEVVKINDFQTLETLDVKTGAKTAIEQDRSNVLQWFTADGTAVSVRPSGTEPKIKFYFGVKAPLASVADFDKTLAELDAKIEGIKKDLKLE